MFGNERIREESLNKAIGLYINILKIYTKERFPDKYAEVQSKLGKAYYRFLLIRNTHEFKENAINALNEAFSIFPQDSQNYGEVLRNKGLILKITAKGELKVLDEAIGCFEESNKIFENGTYKYGANLKEIAGAYKSKFEIRNNEIFIKKAIDHGEKSLTILEEYPFDHANCLNILGISYGKLSRLSEKKRNLEQSISYYSQAKNIYYDKWPYEYGKICNNLGSAYQLLFPVNYKKEYALKAIGLLNESKEIRKKDSYPSAFAMAESNLGTIYRRLAKLNEYENNINESIIHYNEALIYRTKENHKFNHAETLNALALSYIYLSKIKNKYENLKIAENGLTEVFEIAKDGQYDNLLIECLSRFGNLYYELSKIENKENFLKKAIESIRTTLDFQKIELGIYRYGVNQLHLGKMYCELSSIEDSNANFEKSREALNVAKDIFEKEVCYYYSLKTNFYIGKLFFRMAEIDLKNRTDLLKESINYYVLSTKTIKNGQFQLFRAKVIYNMANSYQKFGNDKKSKELYQEAYRILINENVDMNQIIDEKLKQFN